MVGVIKMTPYEMVAPLFDRSTVWVDVEKELFFYRWAWSKLGQALNEDDPAKAILDAITLAYVYQELCYYVCDQNFYEDLWDQLGEFVGDPLTDFQLGFLYGKVSAEDEECPDDSEKVIRELLRGNYRRVVGALSSSMKNDLELLTAFHASCAKPIKTVVDENGDEGEVEMIEDFDSFCRYVDDSDFSDKDICGMDLSEYQGAYEWWTNGAEMLEAR